MRRVVIATVLACSVVGTGLSAQAHEVPAARSAAGAAHGPDGAPGPQAGLHLVIGPGGARRDHIVTGGLTARPQPTFGDPARLLHGPFRTEEAPAGASADLAGMGRPPSMVSPPQNASTGEEGPDADEESTITWRYVEVIGDVTADGTPDVAASASTHPTGEDSMEVRDGRDGSLLWRVANGPAHLTAIGDVDGDGLVDLLLRQVVVNGWEEDESCEDSCQTTYRTELEWTVAVVDGRTGTVQWSTTTPGHWEYSYSYGGEGYGYAESVTAVEAEAVGDHDGDAARDLLLTTITYDYSYGETESDELLGLGLVTSSRTDEQLSGSTQARIARASDGADILVVANEDDGQLSTPAVDIGDVTGDGVEDLRWNTLVLTPASAACTRVVVLGDLDCDAATESSEELRIEVLDGATAAPIWSTVVADPAYTVGIPDIDGDGLDDLMALHADDATTTAISSVDGAILWTVTAEDWLVPMAVDDLDGDADPDVLTAVFHVDEETGEYGLILRRIDGPTGQGWLDTAPLSPSPPVQCGFTYTYIFGAFEDGDHDGHDDPLVGRSTEDYGENCEAAPVSASEAVLESATSGATLHRETADGDVFVAPVDDLDGDGRDDVVRFEYPSGTVWASSGLTGPTLWTVRDPLMWVSTLGADVDGVPGQEVVSYRVVEDEHGNADEVVDVLNGRDLTVIWRLDPTDTAGDGSSPGGGT